MFIVTLTDCQFLNRAVFAGAAVSLPVLARNSIERGFQGLEFAGIPGVWRCTVYECRGVRSLHRELVEE